jgi:hypothetical protein
VATIIFPSQTPFSSTVPSLTARSGALLSIRLGARRKDRAPSPSAPPAVSGSRVRPGPGPGRRRPGDPGAAAGARSGHARGRLTRTRQSASPRLAALGLPGAGPGSPWSHPVPRTCRITDTYGGSWNDADGPCLVRTGGCPTARGGGRWWRAGGSLRPTSGADGACDGVRDR